MKKNNQNPYADIVIDPVPSFIIRYGVILVCLFLALCALIGQNVVIPKEKKVQVFVKHVENSADTLKVAFHINSDDINVFYYYNQDATLQIVDNSHPTEIVTNYALNRVSVNHNNCIIAELTCNKDELPKILAELNKKTPQTYYIINKMDDQSLSEHIFKSLYSLF